MGIFCILAGFIIGALIGRYETQDFLTILKSYLLNTYSIIGYVFLGLGLIGYYLKRKFKKISMKSKNTTSYQTFKDFVNQKIKDEEKD